VNVIAVVVADTYQSITAPLSPVADSVTVPVPQRLAGVIVSINGNGFTVAITGTTDDKHPVAVTLALA
jgi:hypothetical protein